MNILGWDISFSRNKELGLPSPKSKKLISALTGWFNNGLPVFAPENYQAQIDSWTDWVYICSSKNATNVASIPFSIYTVVPESMVEKRRVFKTKPVDKITEKRILSNPGLAKYHKKGLQFEEVVETHPLSELLYNINPWMNRFDFLETLELYLEITGNAYVYIAKDLSGMPAELWIFPSQYMQIVADKDNFIKGYVYNGPNFGQVPFTPDEIIHFKFSNVRNLYYGISPLACTALTYSLDKSFNEYEKAVFDNYGVPAGILTSDQALHQDEFDRMKVDWNAAYGGKKNSGKTAVLEKGLKFQAITMAPKDMAYIKGHQWTMQTIAAAYDVPLSMLTTENVNLANAQEGLKQYQKQCIYPRVKRIEEKFNEKLCSFYDDNLFIMWDDPVQESKEYLLKERVAYVKSGIKTINEVRKDLGLPEVEWGEEPMKSGQSSIPIDAQLDVEEPDGTTE